MSLAANLTTTTTTTTTTSAATLQAVADQSPMQYTCLACQIAFPSSKAQRNHHRTDWHKYNLKRKIAALKPLTAHQFNEKVLTQQARKLEEAEKQDLLYRCPTCNKSYYSENAFNNHIRSKKHLDMLEANGTVTDMSNTTTRTPTTSVIDPNKSCLFCNQHQETFELNLQHMSKHHGFFLPDIEHLTDSEGLIQYLSSKINDQHLCLYCNGRGKQLNSSTAARRHMLDLGHCKMAYDDSEDAEQLLKYYDFSTDEDGDESLMDIDQPFESTSPAASNMSPDKRANVGQRKFLSVYRKKHQQSTRKAITSPKNDEGDVEEAVLHYESLQRTRRERRHPSLAITNGNDISGQMKKTLDGIKEVNIKHNFKQKLSLKQNENQLFRFRTQVPII